MDDLFDQADNLLFNQQKYDEAMTIYKQILKQDLANIDAINSIAYCVRFKSP